MKHTLKNFVLLCAIISGLLFVQCGNGKSGSIEGTWVGEDGTELKFNNGHFSTPYAENWVYDIKGDRLTVALPNSGTIFYHTFTLKGNTLTLAPLNENGNGKVLKYTRKKDDSAKSDGGK